MLHKKHYSTNNPYTGDRKTSLLIAKYWQMCEEEMNKRIVSLSDIVQYELILHRCYNRIIKIAIRIGVSKKDFDFDYSGLLP